MTMKKWLQVLAVVGALVLGWHFGRRSARVAALSGSPAGSPAERKGSQQVQSTETLVQARTDDPSSPASAPAAASSHPSEETAAIPGRGDSPTDNAALPVATVMENMRTTFHHYASEFGGNPVGTNREITRALNGGNRKQIIFIQPGDGLRINEMGELVDSWGTPFFFHQLSGTEMEIHSAGPDRIMWTPDDIVTK